jgi:hypothetical protein
VRIDPEGTEAVRTWAHAGWEDALREGGASLAGKTLARMVMGEGARRTSAVRGALELLIRAGPPIRDGKVEDPLLLYILDQVFWRAFWWNQGDKELGRQWREIRRDAVLPSLPSASALDAAVISCGLAGDRVSCVYGGFLPSLGRDPFGRPR